jgi:putative thioredoxin
MAINVKEENFKKDVLEKSFQVPVVVDFWANWCGPCKVLGPVLEKLEKEYKGAFLLAKVDTDTNQQLAMIFRVSSIPDVRMLHEGKVVDQFIGALPEKEIRTWLDKHVKTESNSHLEKLLQTDPMKFLKELKNTKDQPENKDELLWKAFVVHTKNKGKLEELKEILKEIDEENRSFQNQRRVMLQFLEKGKESVEDLQKLNNKDKTTILDKYLKKVEQAKFEERKNQKDDLLACFYFLDPQDEVLPEYRRKLSSLLF